MKLNRLGIAVCIVIFLLGFCSGTLLSTWHISQEMHRLVAAAQSYQPENSVQMKEGLNQIISAWEKYEGILSIYSRHDEVERISEEIEDLRPLYDNGLYTELHMKLIAADNALKHLLQTEMPTLSNIF